MRIKTSPSKHLILTIRVIVSIAFLGFITSLFRNLVELTQTDERLVQAKLQLTQVEQKNSLLKQQKNLIESGSLDEQQIRNKLRLVKPGETIAIVPQFPNLLNASTSAEQVKLVTKPI